MVTSKPTYSLVASDKGYYHHEDTVKLIGQALSLVTTSLIAAIKRLEGTLSPFQGTENPEKMSMSPQLLRHSSRLKAYVLHQESIPKHQSTTDHDYQENKSQQ